MKPQPFGRYLLLDKVAAGGMAEVWRAKLVGEAGFERVVAIKKILPHVCEDQDFITMFQDEAKITVQLQHANIGQLYEFSKIDGVYYIAMEYISGRDVKSVWSYFRHKKTTMPIEVSCFLISKIADGLDYAHRKRDNFGRELGIVHRDVSPQNVLISWDGEVKVIDFGIAKAEQKSGRTRPGTLKGKFAYMSPEQIRGMPLDGRADVFSLGVVLYELITGERGFSADSDFQLLEMVRNVEIRPPTMVNPKVSQELERIVFKALGKDRKDRFQTASDLSEALMRYLHMSGKPPNRHSLGQFMRENFTVDYDKERLRLESYKEIEYTPPPQQGSVQPVAPSPPAASVTAVQAAIQADLGSAGAPQAPGAFATTTQQGVPIATSAQTQTGMGPGPSTYVQTAGPQAAVTSASDPNALRPPAPMNFPTNLGGSDVTMVGELEGARKRNLLLAAVGGMALIVIVALAVFVFGKPTSGAVAVTVHGASEARVRLDGELIGAASPSLYIEDVDVGEHEIAIEKEGYQLFLKTIQISEGQRLSLETRLKHAEGRIKLTSTPSGASIKIGDQAVKEKTPTMLSVEGEIPHKITLSAPGYKPLVLSKTVEPLGDLEVDVRLVPESIRLEVRSEPKGATIILDGQARGQTPLVIEVSPDDRFPQMILRRRGCQKYESTLVFEKDLAEQTKTFRLTCR